MRGWMDSTRKGGAHVLVPRSEAVVKAYSYAQQARDYRRAAWDRGCTCPELMAPHTHLIECPLYEDIFDYIIRTGTSPADDVSPSPGGVGGANEPSPSPPRDGPDGLRESTPGESQASPGAGDLDPDWHLDRDWKI